MEGIFMVSGILDRLGIEPLNLTENHGSEITVTSPIDGVAIARVRLTAEEDYDDAVYDALQVFDRRRMHPAPKRGEIVRQIVEER